MVLVSYQAFESQPAWVQTLMNRAAISMTDRGWGFTSYCGLLILFWNLFMMVLSGGGWIKISSKRMSYWNCLSGIVRTGPHGIHILLANHWQFPRRKGGIPGGCGNASGVRNFYPIFGLPYLWPQFFLPWAIKFINPHKFRKNSETRIMISNAQHDRVYAALALGKMFYYFIIFQNRVHFIFSFFHLFTLQKPKKVSVI